MDLNKCGIILSIALLVGCSSDKDLAKVGEKAIGYEQFDAHLKFKRIDSSKSERVEAELDDYLKQTAMAQVISDEEAYDAQLIDAEIEEFRKQMLINRYFESYLDGVVSEAAIENYYKTNSEDFSVKQANVSHVVIRVNPAMNDSEKQAAHQKAQSAYAQLVKGVDFAQVVQDFSEDLYSKKRNGDLGWVNEKSVEPAFSSVAFNLEKDEISTVIETQFGFHIIKAKEPVRTQLIPLDQVKGDIRYQLRLKAKQAEIARLLEQVEITKNELK